MNRSQRGLTMIEVLAAMVIFSAGAVVLFGWIGQTAERLGRLNAEQKQLFANLLALEYLRGLNPMQRPAGEQSLAGATLRWQASPVGIERSSIDMGGLTGGRGLYVVQLYRTEYQVALPGRDGSSQWLYLAGWRQTSSASTGGLFAPPPTATR